MDDKATSCVILSIFNAFYSSCPYFVSGSVHSTETWVFCIRRILVLDENCVACIIFPHCEMIAEATWTSDRMRNRLVLFDGKEVLVVLRQRGYSWSVYRDVPNISSNSFIFYEVIFINCFYFKESVTWKCIHKLYEYNPVV